jgi:hypothetical protein
MPRRDISLGLFAALSLMRDRLGWVELVLATVPVCGCPDQGLVILPGEGACLHVFCPSCAALGTG